MPDASTGYVILGDAESALYSVAPRSENPHYYSTTDSAFLSYTPPISVKTQISNEDKLPMIPIMSGL